eukprot:976720-Rhodomonas_salina.1
MLVRPRYAISGTEVGYGARRCWGWSRSLRPRRSLPRSPPPAPSEYGGSAAVYGGGADAVYGGDTEAVYGGDAAVDGGKTPDYGGNTATYGGNMTHLRRRQRHFRGRCCRK